jgi:hypothetical protein
LTTRPQSFFAADRNAAIFDYIAALIPLAQIQLVLVLPSAVRSGSLIPS